MKEKIFKIQGEKIKIQRSIDVFPPSPHGTRGLGKKIKIKKGEIVCDIGCGTGVLGIFAAKKGGKVFASDLVPEAISLAQKNAALNKVNLNILKGDLFSPFQGKKFDVIIANVPQEIISPKTMKKYNHKKIISMWGGKDGTRLILKTLRQAPKYMKQNSRFYVVVFTLTHFRKTLSFISKNYDAKLLGLLSSEVKKFVYEDPQWYASQNDAFCYKKKDKYFADLLIFELNLPKK